MNWNQLPSDEDIEKTANALRENGFLVEIAETGEAAKQVALKLIPKGAEVMTNTSKTLQEIGLSLEINESGNYNAIHPKVLEMDQGTQQKEIISMRVTADWNIGSGHALTQDGHVLIASGSGSQIPGYAYTSPHVLMVFGAQKIVENVEQGMKRIYEHSLPLESERARIAYGTAGSNVSKILIVNADKNPDRFHIIIVKEILGF